MQEENKIEIPKDLEIPDEDYWNPGERFGIDANGNETIKSYGFTTSGLVATIRGSPVTEKQDMDFLFNIFAARNMNNVAEIALSAPEHGTTEQSHQHLAVLLKENKKVVIPQAVKLPSGKMIMIYANQMTTYSQETKDIVKLIEYMEKEKPCIHHYTAPDAKNSARKSKKVAWDTAIKEAINMPTLASAERYLFDHSASDYLRQQKTFQAMYMRKHERENQMKETYNPNLLPFKDLPETQQIMDWVNRASVNNRKRNGILFIVGPTKTGKTEFIIQNVYRKYHSFLMRGNYLWDKYDSTDRHIKFLIFDDVDPTMQMVRDIKALTSTKNTPTQMNIKYGFAVVKSAPCIILMNENNYEKYWKDIGYAKETDWYRKNSVIIKIEDFLYPLKSELRKMEIEKRKELRNNNQEDMSEHSIENFDDDKTEEIQQDEEQEEVKKEINNEKKPKEKTPYERKSKHSFRSRVKHLLKRMNKDDEQIEQFMDEMDEIGLNDIEDKEAIEYGFNTDDDVEDHPSLEEEIEGEKARKQLANINNPQPEEEYEDEEPDEFNGLPPATSGYATQKQSSLLGYDPDVIYN